MTNGDKCIFDNNTGQNREDQSQEGEIKLYTWNHLLRIKTAMH